MRLRSRQWRHAAECIEALLAGLDRRPFPTGSHEYCLAASIFGTSFLKPSGGTSTGGYGSQPSPSLVYRGGGGFSNLGYSFTSSVPPEAVQEDDQREAPSHEEGGNPLIPTMRCELTSQPFACLPLALILSCHVMSCCRNPGPPFADEIDWTLPLRAPSLSPSPSPGGGGYASYPRTNPMASRLGAVLTKSCSRGALSLERVQGASLGVEIIESMIPAGLGKEAGILSLPLISLLSSAIPSSSISHGELLALRTRIILALSSGGSATREALREASMSFALEGGATTFSPFPLISSHD